MNMLKRFVVKKNEHGLLLNDGDFEAILEPGQYKRFDWQGRLTLKNCPQDSPLHDYPLERYLRQHEPALVEQYFLTLDMAENEVGLRFEDGQLKELLAADSRRLQWKGPTRQSLTRIDLAQGRRLDAELLARLNKPGIAGMDNVLLVTVPTFSVGVLRIDGVVVDLLPAGQHGFWRCGAQVVVDTVDTRRPVSDVNVRELLARGMDQHLVCMDLSEHEVGLRFEDGKLVEVLPPDSRRAYWKDQARHELQRIDLTYGQCLDAELVTRLNRPGIAGMDHVLLALVPAFHVGVLKIDGVVAGLLEPGQHGYWRCGSQVAVEMVDTRLQALEVSGQEILTRDKVNLRLSLVANWRYTDVLGAHGQMSKPVEHLYRELQFGLRAAVGTRTLDELLENKQLIDDSVTEHLQAQLPGSGLEVGSLGLRDIILPGEMKTLLAQVVEAEKAAQANVIRRREETQATRSLLNTAKVMEGNPTALRLKELETLERVAERIDRISVFGGLDQVLNGMVSLKAG